jgi:DNA-binding CsgD family transcriptional regulator
MQMFDMPLAERLAERALGCGAGFEAGLVVGEARFRSGRLQEAESVLAATADRCASDMEVARIANARAYNLHTLMRDPDAAAAVLERALAVVQDEPARLLLLARHAVNRMIDGFPEEALAAAAPLLETGDDGFVSRGAYVASVSLALLGRSEESVAMASRGFDTEGHAEQSTQLAVSRLVGAILAHTASGELGEADAVAETVREACLSAGDRDGEATALLLGAWAQVERGHLVSACRDFLESASINRQVQDRLALRWCLGGVALAEGMRGRADRARAAVEELDGLPTGGINLYAFDLVERGRAWAQVARGELSGAARTLEEAAAHAAAACQWVAEGRLLYDLARLGHAAAVAARLDELTGVVEGGMAAAFARHATGLARTSPADIEAAALAFSSLDAALYAAEAELTAARLFQDERLLRRAAACTRRAETMLGRCEDARTPGVHRANELPLLTRREREIAGLAAAGTSSKDIADKLFLSVRTVDNHLQRVYGKLGVGSRAELAEALLGLEG